MKRGKLTVIGGPMFAGKTTLLQKRVGDVLLLIPVILVLFPM